METPTEFYKWWVTDERTGKRQLTTYKLSRVDAERAFPGAEPDMQTREVRNLPDLRQDPWGNTRPGEPWDDAKPGG